MHGEHIVHLFWRSSGIVRDCTRQHGLTHTLESTRAHEYIAHIYSHTYTYIHIYMQMKAHIRVCAHTQIVCCSNMYILVWGLRQSEGLATGFCFTWFLLSHKCSSIDLKINLILAVTVWLNLIESSDWIWNTVFLVHLHPLLKPLYFGVSIFLSSFTYDRV